MPKKPELAPGELLIAEYNYIAQAIFQNNEDRARASSFYMTSFGSFIAVLVTYQFNITSVQDPWIRWGFAGLFLALAFMGVVIIFQLANLRYAWLEGVDAMNRVKDYYIVHFDGLENAFAWGSKQVPSKFKPSSMGFIMVVQIAVVSSASFALSIFLATLSIYGVYWPLLACLAGIAFALFQVWLYRRLLK